MLHLVLRWKPMSTQHCYWMRGKKKYMQKEAKDLKSNYIQQINQQYSWKILENQVGIMVKIYFWDRRKRDWDNFHKLSMDSLEWTVLVNDSQIRKAIVELAYDKEDPRIEIWIHDLRDSNLFVD